MKKIISLIICAIIFVACSDSKKYNTFEVKDEIISDVSAEDEQMNAAMRKARATFNDFKDTFVKNHETNKYHSFAIKIGFKSPMYGKEHMWVKDLRLDGKEFLGTLSNKSADLIIRYRAGDTLVVDPEKVSDWMYIDDSTGIVCGGYTYRVIRSHMSDEEKKEYDELIGLKFE